MQKAIFLDRDGVINRAIVKNGKPYPPASIDEFTIPENVKPALTEFKNLGYLLIVATNQPDVARGKTSHTFVESIHARLRVELPLDDIRVCFHDDDDGCQCRKPLPGLLISAANDFNIDLQKCFMIGDRWKDIEAGKKAGCKTIFINHAYQEPPAKNADFTTDCLLQAVNWIKQK